MSDINERATKWFDRVFVAVMFIVIIVSVVAIVKGYNDTRHIHHEKVNTDSLRKIHQGLQLRTLEDSVHYYEDGM